MDNYYYALSSSVDTSDENDVKPSGNIIYFYPKDIKYGATNDYIGFVEPLNSDPTTSVFNLNQIKVSITVRCYVKLSEIGTPSDFEANSASAITLFKFMNNMTELPYLFIGTEEKFSSGTPIRHAYYQVILKSINISNIPERYYVPNLFTGVMEECNDVELIMEKAVML